EDARAGEEAHALGNLEREAGAAARHDVDDELGMLPILELVARHVEGMAGDLAHQHVGLADPEVAGREAHRRAAVAAAAGLMEHERAMPVLEYGDQPACGSGAGDTLDHAPLLSSSGRHDGRPPITSTAAQKKPSAFGL